MTKLIPLSRLLPACVVSALASASTLTLLSESASWLEGDTGPSLAGIVFPFAFTLALLHALALGLPVYLVLSARWQLNLLRALAGGFLVGFIPFTAVSLVGELLTNDPALMSVLLWSLLSGFLGVVGGAAFWGTVRSRRNRR